MNFAKDLFAWSAVAFILIGMPVIAFYQGEVETFWTLVAIFLAAWAIDRGHMIPITIGVILVLIFRDAWPVITCGTLTYCFLREL